MNIYQVSGSSVRAKFPDCPTTDEGGGQRNTVLADALPSGEQSVVALPLFSLEALKRQRLVDWGILVLNEDGFALNPDYPAAAVVDIQSDDPQFEVLTAQIRAFVHQKRARSHEGGVLLLSIGEMIQQAIEGMGNVEIFKCGSRVFQELKPCFPALFSRVFSNLTDEQVAGLFEEGTETSTFGSRKSGDEDCRLVTDTPDKIMAIAKRILDALPSVKDEKKQAIRPYEVKKNDRHYGIARVVFDQEKHVEASDYPREFICLSRSGNRWSVTDTYVHELESWMIRLDNAFAVEEGAPFRYTIFCGKPWDSRLPSALVGLVTQSTHFAKTDYVAWYKKNLDGLRTHQKGCERQMVDDLISQADEYLKQAQFNNIDDLDRIEGRITPPSYLYFLIRLAFIKLHSKLEDDNARALFALRACLSFYRHPSDALVLSDDDYRYVWSKLNLQPTDSKLASLASLIISGEMPFSVGIACLQLFTQLYQENKLTDDNQEPIFLTSQPVSVSLPANLQRSLEIIQEWMKGQTEQTESCWKLYGAWVSSKECLPNESKLAGQAVALGYSTEQIQGWVKQHIGSASDFLTLMSIELGLLFCPKEIAWLIVPHLPTIVSNHRLPNRLRASFSKMKIDKVLHPLYRKVADCLKNRKELKKNELIEWLIQSKDSEAYQLADALIGEDIVPVEWIQSLLATGDKALIVRAFTCFEQIEEVSIRLKNCQYFNLLLTDKEDYSKFISQFYLLSSQDKMNESELFFNCLAIFNRHKSNKPLLADQQLSDCLKIYEKLLLGKGLMIRSENQGNAVIKLYHWMAKAFPAFHWDELILTHPFSLVRDSKISFQQARNQIWEQKFEELMPADAGRFFVLVSSAIAKGAVNMSDLKTDFWDNKLKLLSQTALSTVNIDIYQQLNRLCLFSNEPMIKPNTDRKGDREFQAALKESQACYLQFAKKILSQNDPALCRQVADHLHTVKLLPKFEGEFKEFLIEFLLVSFKIEHLGEILRNVEHVLAIHPALFQDIVSGFLAVINEKYQDEAVGRVLECLNKYIVKTPIKISTADFEQIMDFINRIPSLDDTSQGEILWSFLAKLKYLPEKNLKGFSDKLNRTHFSIIALTHLYNQQEFKNWLKKSPAWLDKLIADGDHTTICRVFDFMLTAHSDIAKKWLNRPAVGIYMHANPEFQHLLLKNIDKIAVEHIQVLMVVGASHINNAELQTAFAQAAKNECLRLESIDNKSFKEIVFYTHLLNHYQLYTVEKAAHLTQQLAVLELDESEFDEAERIAILNWNHFDLPHLSDDLFADWVDCLKNCRSKVVYNIYNDFCLEMASGECKEPPIKNVSEEFPEGYFRNKAMVSNCWRIYQSILGGFVNRIAFGLDCEILFKKMLSFYTLFKEKDEYSESLKKLVTDCALEYVEKILKSTRLEIFEKILLTKQTLIELIQERKNSDFGLFFSDRVRELALLAINTYDRKHLEENLIADKFVEIDKFYLYIMGQQGLIDPENLTPYFNQMQAHIHQDNIFNFIDYFYCHIDDPNKKRFKKQGKFLTALLTFDLDTGMIWNADKRLDTQDIKANVLEKFSDIIQDRDALSCQILNEYVKMHCDPSRIYFYGNTHLSNDGVIERIYNSIHSIEGAILFVDNLLTLENVNSKEWLVSSFTKDFLENLVLRWITKFHPIPKETARSNRDYKDYVDKSVTLVEKLVYSLPLSLKKEPESEQWGMVDTYVSLIEKIKDFDFRGDSEITQRIYHLCTFTSADQEYSKMVPFEKLTDIFLTGLQKILQGYSYDATAIALIKFKALLKNAPNIPKIQSLLPVFEGFALAAKKFINLDKNCGLSTFVDELLQLKALLKDQYRDTSEYKLIVLSLHQAVYTIVFDNYQMRRLPGYMNKHYFYQMLVAFRDVIEIESYTNCQESLEKWIPLVIQYEFLELKDTKTVPEALRVPTGDLSLKFLSLVNVELKALEEAKRTHNDLYISRQKQIVDTFYKQMSALSSNDNRVEQVLGYLLYKEVIYLFLGSPSKPNRDSQAVHLRYQKFKGEFWKDQDNFYWKGLELMIEKKNNQQFIPNLQFFTERLRTVDREIVPFQHSYLSLMNMLTPEITDWNNAEGDAVAKILLAFYEEGIKNNRFSTINSKVMLVDFEWVNNNPTYFHYFELFKIKFLHPDVQYNLLSAFIDGIELELSNGNAISTGLVDRFTEMVNLCIDDPLKRSALVSRFSQVMPTIDPKEG